ncbi:MAG: flagellar hook-basal body complex protein [Verrucomicrobia bacterium]|nr:flagellar hook-basal body complex protein [Verrucomicrobiota bacterium]MCF7707902.1 flagellar hook-basal body complex protein [Verrucomicrobiota bacterium]
MNTGVSGLQQFQQKMDVIGNNIANVNTVGFKTARAEITESFYNALQSSTAVSDDTDTQSIQIGTGVGTAEVRNVFSQGSISDTGVPSDLAISGDGYFVVKDPLSGMEYATRDGRFKLDAQGYLTNSGGCRVQGYSSLGNTTGGSDALGDIKVDNTIDGTTLFAPGDQSATPPTEDAVVSSFAINSQGEVVVKLSNGDQYKRGQVLLQSFGDPSALVKEGNGLYSGFESAGALGGTSPQPAAPGTKGLGAIRAGALELSNVDLAAEFTDMITAQRAFQASSRIITTSDQLMQDIINLKR